MGTGEGAKRPSPKLVCLLALLASGWSLLAAVQPAVFLSFIRELCITTVTGPGLSSQRQHPQWQVARLSLRTCAPPFSLSVSPPFF